MLDAGMHTAEEECSTCAAEEWVEYVTAEGLPYFYNVTTGATVWELPNAENEEPLSPVGSASDTVEEDDAVATSFGSALTRGSTRKDALRARRAEAAASAAVWAKGLVAEKYGRVRTGQGADDDDAESGAESESSEEDWSSRRYAAGSSISLELLRASHALARRTDIGLLTSYINGGRTMRPAAQR